MTKSAFAIVIMAFAMVAMLAFGGTYAYFTSTAKGFNGNVHTGYVKLTATDTQTAITLANNVLPGDSLITGDISYEVDTTDTLGNYVAIKVELAVMNGSEVDTTKTAALKLGDIKLNADDWTAHATAGIYYTANPVADGASVTLKAADLKLPVTVESDWNSTSSPAAATPAIMDIDVKVVITVKSIQASNLTGTAADAVATLF